jgi:VWFA-related protein
MRALLIAALLAPLALPQEPVTQTPPALSKKTPNFDVTTQLVVVNVAAKTKAGDPIPDLKASDFTVLEDGKPQQLKIFEFQHLEDAVLPAPALVRRPEEAANSASPASLPAVKSSVAVAIAPAKPGEIKYRDRRLLVLFFDQAGMPVADQLRTQQSALKFLNSQITQSDLVSIMTYDTSLSVKQDFTDDRDKLTQVIKALSIGDVGMSNGSTGADSDGDTGAAYSADDTEFNIFNTDRKLAALESAVKMLGSLAEKKALVYFASGMSLSGTDNQAQLRATINAAIRGNVAFYPVDARGLVATAPLGDATQASQGGQGMYSGSSMRTAQAAFQGQQDSLYTLASDTGGKALLDQNDLSLGIQQAQKDMASYYILGYYSTNTALDGRFRRIQVKMARNATAKLDYRSGYFAGKDFKQFNSSDRERQLQEALMLGDPVTDISVAAEINYFRQAKDRYFVPVSVKIPGSDIELARKSGAESTLEYDTGFTLQPGTYTLKFLARENQTGKMGTFESKFVVPDLTTDAKRLPISSVVIGYQREAVDAALATAEKDKKLIAANPLVQDKQKLVPSVTRVFRQGQDLYVFLEAYQPNAEKTQYMVATLTFYRGGVKAFETAPLQVTEGLNAKSKAVPVSFTVPLGKLQPGRYTCQVNVLEPSVQKFAVWRSAMVLLP